MCEVSVMWFGLVFGCIKKECGSFLFVIYVY